MCKAIICSDDRVLLRDLNQNIDWAAAGIALHGNCADGYSAQFLLEREKPDIFICGIRLIGTNGFRLAELAKGHNPNVRCILLSDSEDFGSALQALRLGVHDLLCTPINYAALQLSLQRAADNCRVLRSAQALIVESERNTRKDQMQCLVFEGLQALEERYGDRVLHDFCNQFNQVCMVSIDHFEPSGISLSEEQASQVNRLFFRTLEKFEDRLTVFEKQHGFAACIIMGSSFHGVLRSRSECVREIREGFRKNCPSMTLTFAFSTIRPSAADLQKSYREAQQALQERFVRPPGSEIYYDRIRSVPDLMSGEPEDVPAVTDLVAEIRKGNRNGVKEEIEKLGKRMQEIGGQSQLFMKFYSGNIFFSIQQDLQQYGINVQQLDLNLMKEYQLITELQNMNQVMRQLYSYCSRIMDALEENGSNNGARAVVKARAYIDEHYSNHDLNMDDVAGYVHMSPSYFSVIFKQETGISFTDYLISLRIRKSKELIRNSNLKIYEIAARSGYDTAAYYSTAFKKETGMSPSEYKKKYLRSRESGAAVGV